MCRILCFTRGEASTLGPGQGDLAQRRARELEAAGDALGAAGTILLGHPDGELALVPLARLAGQVRRHARRQSADALLVFDEEGITGHPDHVHATRAALAAAKRDGTTVLAWVLPHRVAEILNDELGTSFVGRDPNEIDISIEVDRGPQLNAIACHASQSADNPVLRRRLELLGDVEHLRYLYPTKRT